MKFDSHFNLSYNASMAEFILQHKIEPNMVRLAEKLSLKESLNRSITGGERNVMGTLAELYVLKFFNCLVDEDDIDYTPTYDYDLLVNGLKIDIKCKQRTVEPKPDYAASIVAYSKLKQKCDLYAFTNITVGRNDPSNFKDFYLLGFMSKTKYFSTSEFKRKGESDGGNRLAGGKEFKIREDCYNLPYGDLWQYGTNEIDNALNNEFKMVFW